jgi:hypothetical protein
MEAYNIHKVLDEFSAAREHFNLLIDCLSSEETASAAHGDVEQLIKDEGIEVLRRLFQGYFDLKGARETPLESVRGNDGVLRTHRVAGCTRPLESYFGEVTVTRMRYGCPGSESLFPLDAAMNLPPGKYSHGLQKVLGDESAKASFGEAVAVVDKMTGGHVPKRQAQNLMSDIAVDFEAFNEKKQLEGPEDTKDLLLMTSDGKGVVMRENSLRESTRQSAEKEREESRGKKSARLEPGKKKNRKRMSTVTAVYTVEPFVRTPEEVMSVLEKQHDESINEKRERPRPTNKRVAASLKKSPQQVITEMFADAQHRDPEHRRHWGVVVDGDGKQLRYIKQAAKNIKADVTIVIDIVHVSEYLWKAAYCFFDVGSDEAQEWVADKMLEVLRGNAGQVAGGMRRSATMLKYSAEERKNIDKCAYYLLSKKQYMQYDKYLAAGLPIGSGVIEGACRYLVKDRMEITGARWGLDNAEAILKLRALRTTDLLDDYWNFHQEEERKRHHTSRYASTPELKLRVIK